MENKKKGMLFGKINIIDIAILLLVIGVGAFFASRFFGVGNSEFVRAQTVHVTFFKASSPDFVSPNTNIGDSVWDDIISQYIGTVVDIRTDEPVEFHMDADNVFHRIPRDGYESVFLTIEARGIVTGNGVVLGGTIYAPGHSTVLYAGLGKYFMRVHSLEVIGE
jgi:hypothetical protein